MAQAPDTPTPGGPGPGDATALMKDSFAAEFGSRAEQQPSAEKAIGQPNGELTDGLTRADTQIAALPHINLIQEELDKLAGKRNPLLGLVAERFAAALDKFEGPGKDTGVTADIFRWALDNEGAANMSVNVADMIIQGADNGDLLVSSVLAIQTGMVLPVARARCNDPLLTGEERSTTDAAFAAAIQAEAERSLPALVNAAALAASGAPIHQGISQSDAMAADAHVMDAWDTVVNNTSPAIDPAHPAPHHRKPHVPGPHAPPQHKPHAPPKHKPHKPHQPPKPKGTH